MEGDRKKLTLAQDVQLSGWDLKRRLSRKTRGMFTILGVHGPARGRVYRNCFQSFQKGGMAVITRLLEQNSNKTRTTPACFLAGGMGTDLLDHENHERHEKMGFSSVSCFSWLKPRFGFRWGGFLLGILLLMGLGGCASFEKKYEEKFMRSSWFKSAEFFMKHPSPLVEYPTYVGMAPGVATMVPIWASGCVTYGLQQIFVPETKDVTKVISPCFIPSHFLMISGANLVGAPCWALFGWWWPEDDYKILKPERPEGRPAEQKPESGQTDLR